MYLGKVGSSLLLFCRPLSLLVPPASSLVRSNERCPTLMVTSRFSLCPLSAMAATSAKTLAIKIANGFLSGFCFVIFSFSRLTGPPPTQAAAVFHQPGIVETRNLVHEWTISLPPSLFHVFWFLVNYRPLSALEVCLAKVVVLHTRTPFSRLSCPNPHPHIFTLPSPYAASGPPA